ncbi:MAG TPA: arginine repressor [Planctomycetota bacterium]|jgi:transcriptional regulator of arginine metabolism|nr:arginine repressor [Planctomycetota bacterium]
MDLKRSNRLSALRELLLESPVASQAALVRALRKRGHDVTQSSISRDLRDVSAVKTAQGYALPEALGAPPPARREVDFLKTLVRGIVPAGPNLLVVHTGTGSASRVGLALDRFRWPEVAGTVAGDDTLFVAVHSLAGRKRLEKLLAELLAS